MDSLSDSGFESDRSWFNEKTNNQSRRVIFSNLPASTSVNQLLQIVRGEGGIITVDIYNTSKLSNSGAQTAVVEFTYPASAKAYVEIIKQTSPAIEGDDGEPHVPEIWLSHAEANIYHYHVSFMLQNGFTRIVKAVEFPAKAVWFCLCALGLKKIVNAYYNQKTSVLTIGFVSVFYAERAISVLREGRLLYYTPDQRHLQSGDFNMSLVTPAMDPTDGDSSDLVHLSTLATFIPSNDLEQKFNRLPYNQAWPESWLPIMNLEGLRPQPFQNRMLDLIQKHTFFSRQKWSWEVSEADKNDHSKMVETLDNPDWKDA